VIRNHTLAKATQVLLAWAYAADSLRRSNPYFEFALIRGKRKPSGVVRIARLPCANPGLIEP
jgi:hypothetical protein